MLSIYDAQIALVNAVQPKNATVNIALAEALNYVLATDVTANMNVPPADNSAMDGYAFFASNTIDAGTEFTLSQTIAAGTQPTALQPGTAARILTGAELPSGANTVAIQENVHRQHNSITLLNRADPGDNVRPAGQDIKKGQIISKAREKLTPAHLGVLASVGVTHIDAFKPINVALLNTGQELVSPGTPLKPGQIYNSNAYTLQALLTQSGCNVVTIQTLPDDLHTTISALKKHSPQCDLIITSGGVSVGDEDHVKNAVQAIGTLDLWKIRLKPGKPLAFGFIQPESSTTKTPILGLPGNPVSAYVTFLLFALPLIKKLQGRGTITPAAGFKAAVQFCIDQPRKRPEYLRVQYTEDGLIPYNNQSSGVLHSVQWADGLAFIPADTHLKIGDTVTYIPFQDFFL